MNGWLQCWVPRPPTAPRLVCFPHAGGSAGFFQSWAAALPEAEVQAVRYPGRADRMGEPHRVDLVGQAGEIADALTPLLDGPLALFGHSMGATLAYETARTLERRGTRPAHLFLSGARAAHLEGTGPNGRRDRGDAALTAELRALGGTDERFLDSRLFLDLVLPYVRADFLLLDTYVHRPGPLLRTPVTVFLGAADPQVTLAQSTAWQDLFATALDHRTLPGGHFYLATSPPVDRMRSVLSGTAVRPAVRW